MIVSSVSYICLLISPALGFQRISNDSDFPFWHISRYFFPPCHSQITNPSPVISYHFHADTDWLLKNSLPLYLLHSLVLLHLTERETNTEMTAGVSAQYI